MFFPQCYYVSLSLNNSKLTNRMSRSELFSETLEVCQVAGLGARTNRSLKVIHALEGKKMPMGPGGGSGLQKKEPVLDVWVLDMFDDADSNVLASFSTWSLCGLATVTLSSDWGT